MQTIMVLADDSNVRRPAVSLLRNCGYRVLEAETELEALQVCDSHSVDLALIGASMTENDVVTDLQRGHPATKIAFMSGYDNLAVVSNGPEIRREELWAELEMIARPIGPTALIRRIRELLQDKSPPDSASGSDTTLCRITI